MTIAASRQSTGYADWPAPLLVLAQTPNLESVQTDLQIATQMLSSHDQNGFNQATWKALWERTKP